jgi:hypothetical protein
MFPRKKSQRSTVPVVRRRAGQSLREEWDRLVNENLPFLVFIPGMLWFVWFTQRLPIANNVSPNFWLALAIVVTGIAAIAYLRLIPKARNLVRGERGELRVAEILDELRGSGYRVYHDLVEDGFNNDHVVVGPTGVYAIETKFRSGSGVIEYRNGEGLFVGNNKLEEDRDPLAQARGSARAVRERLKDDTGLNRHVKAVLVFVGDWKIKNVWRDTDVAVLSTKELATYFDRYQPELRRDELTLIASHLERSAKSC